jgi:hypothetical protein
MVQEDDPTNNEPSSLQPEALLDPIRIAVQAFVGNVDDSTKQMTAAAERFATDYAHLIQVAGEARRQAAEARAARMREQEAAAEAPEQAVAEAPQPVVTQAAEPLAAEMLEERAAALPEPMVASVQTPEPAMTRPQDPAVEDLQRSAVAVTQAASLAADAARDAAAGAARVPTPSQAETEATNKRLERVEEDLGVLTGLMRELLEKIGTGQVAVQPASKEPAPKISRRLRMRAAREARQGYLDEKRKTA